MHLARSSVWWVLKFQTFPFLHLLDDNPKGIISVLYNCFLMHHSLTRYPERATHVYITHLAYLSTAQVAKYCPGRQDVFPKVCSTIRYFLSPYVAMLTDPGLLGPGRPFLAWCYGVTDTSDTAVLRSGHFGYSGSVRNASGLSTWDPISGKKACS